MKKISFVFFWILILGGAYFLQNAIVKELKNISSFFLLEPLSGQIKLTEISQPYPETSKEILSSPLKRIEGQVSGVLTKEGIVKYTNLQREKFGLLPLKPNRILEESARLKLEDMFKNQYFAHTSPEGFELKDFAQKAGYDYILIGENLAMGHFKNDEDLVLAWMGSPGHRENILNEKYQEIGVAVKEGIFQGKKIWIAVQHFGKPISACPEPDKTLKLKIEKNEKILDSLAKKIQTLKEEIEGTNITEIKDLRRKIGDYNSLVTEYNELLFQTKNLISIYNNQVKIFNECASE